MDLIIDQFACRPRDLASCSLVCFSWHASTIRHTLNSVAIDTEARDEFLRYLKENVNISHHIKRLKLVGPRRSPESPPICCTIYAILVELPQLWEVQVHSAVLRVDASDITGPKTFPNVLSLTVEHVSTALTTALMQLFPGLRDLYLDDIVGDNLILPPLPQNWSKNLHLRQLTLDERVYTGAFTVASRVVASCSTLRCGSFSYGQLQSAPALGETLTRIEVWFLSDNTWSDTHRTSHIPSARSSRLYDSLLC